MNLFDLKPCPKCGKKEAVWISNSDRSVFAICCTNCNTQSKKQETIYDAIVEWNKQ